MASSSGNSSGCPQFQNSGSEEGLQLLVDQRKRKRMQSNRESARRSRMRKQKHVNDLMAQVTQLGKESNLIRTSINDATQQYLNVEAENSVLRVQIVELNQRLDSLKDILHYMKTSNGGFETEDLQASPESWAENPWNMMYLNQPIMASADMLPY